MIKDNGFSCEPEFRAFSGYPIIKSSLDAGNIDVFAMDRSTLAGYMNETVELLQPEVKFGEQGYGVATKKGCDLSAVVEMCIRDSPRALAATSLWRALSPETWISRCILTTTPWSRNTTTAAGKRSTARPKTCHVGTGSFW